MRRYLFFDDIHPTEQGHRLLRNDALRVLEVQVFGDVNGDFEVDRRDVRALAREFGPCGPSCVADLDGNQWVNVNDLRILLRLIGCR